MIGNTNGIVEADGNADKFGLMPFLSEDGTQNVFVLNVNRFYGLNKKLKQSPQKLEDALKVMRVLSTVAGTSALQPATALKSRCKGRRHLLRRCCRCPECRQYRALYLFRLGKHHRDHRP